MTRDKLLYHDNPLPPALIPLLPPRRRVTFYSDPSLTKAQRIRGYRLYRKYEHAKIAKRLPPVDRDAVFYDACLSLSDETRRFHLGECSEDSYPADSRSPSKRKRMSFGSYCPTSSSADVHTVSKRCTDMSWTRHLYIREESAVVMASTMQEACIAGRSNVVDTNRHSLEISKGETFMDVDVHSLALCSNEHMIVDQTYVPEERMKLSGPGAVDRKTVLTNYEEPDFNDRMEVSELAIDTSMNVDEDKTLVDIRMDDGSPDETLVNIEMEDVIPGLDKTEFIPMDTDAASLGDIQGEDSMQLCEATAPASEEPAKFQTVFPTPPTQRLFGVDLTNAYPIHAEHDCNALPANQFIVDNPQGKFDTSFVNNHSEQETNTMLIDDETTKATFIDNEFGSVGGNSAFSVSSILDALDAPSTGSSGVLGGLTGNGIKSAFKKWFQKVEEDVRMAGPDEDAGDDSDEDVTMESDHEADGDEDVDMNDDDDEDVDMDDDDDDDDDDDSIAMILDRSPEEVQTPSMNEEGRISGEYVPGFALATVNELGPDETTIDKLIDELSIGGAYEQPLQDAQPAVGRPRQPRMTAMMFFEDLVESPIDPDSDLVSATIAAAIGSAARPPSGLSIVDESGPLDDRFECTPQASEADDFLADLFSKFV